MLRTQLPRLFSEQCCFFVGKCTRTPDQQKTTHRFVRSTATTGCGAMPFLLPCANGRTALCTAKLVQPSGYVNSIPAMRNRAKGSTTKVASRPYNLLQKQLQRGTLRLRRSWPGPTFSLLSAQRGHNHFVCIFPICGITTMPPAVRFRLQSRSSTPPLAVRRRYYSDPARRMTLGPHGSVGLCMVTPGFH